MPNHPSVAPRQVLAYLSRYTHRVAISNSRIDQRRCQHCCVQMERLPHQEWRRQKRDAAGNARVHPPLSDPCASGRVPPHPPLRPAGQLDPQGQHRKGPRVTWRSNRQNTKIRQTAEIIPLTLREPCPDCGGQMRIIETFRRGQKPQTPRTAPEKAAA